MIDKKEKKNRRLLSFILSLHMKFLETSKEEEEEEV